MNFNQALEYGVKILKKYKIKNPILDTELLLGRAVKSDRERVLINLETEIKHSQFERFKIFLEERTKKKPVSQILGFKEFWKESFFVNKNVLTPRPETEIIIDQSLKILKNKNKKLILDIGTGSGCLVISLIKIKQNCYGHAIDISKKALEIANINAKIHQVQNKIKFFNIDVDKYKSNKYDLILSNPPYVNRIDLLRLEDDVKLHEPKKALFGGNCGFIEIEKVIKKSNQLLKVGGKLIIEIGHKQKFRTAEMLKKKGFLINKYCKDLKGKFRVIVSTKLN